MSAVAALLLALMGTDRLGDPLGIGTTARYGTTRLCLGLNNGELRTHPTRQEVYAWTAGLYADWSNPNRRPDRFRTLGFRAPSGESCLAHGPYKTDDRFHPDVRFDSTGHLRMINFDLWDVPSGRFLRTIPRHGDAETYPNVVGFTQEHIATLGVPGKSKPKEEENFAAIRVCRVSDGQQTPCVLRVRAQASVALTWPDRLLWVAEDHPGEIRSHSPESGALCSWRPMSLESDTDPEPLLRVSGDGRRLFTVQLRINAKADRYRGRPECFVRVFDTAEKRLEARYEFRLDDTGREEAPKPPDNEDEVRYDDFIVSDDGRFFAWTDHHDRLHIRHLPSGRTVTAQGSLYQGCKFAFTAGAKWLAASDGVESAIWFIDPTTGRIQPTHDSPARRAHVAAVSPDGRAVATSHLEGSLWLWDAQSAKPLWHAQLDGSQLRELHFNPTGTTVSAVGFWGTAGVRTFDAKTGKELGPMLPYRYFRTIAVSADGKRIIDLIEEKSIQEKGEWAYPLFVRTREVATGKELNRVRLDHRLGLGNESNAVVSRDGRMMVVTHNRDGGETIAYDTATGKRLAELSPPTHGGTQEWQVRQDGQILVQSTLPKTLTDGTPLRMAVYSLAASFPDKPIRVIDSQMMFWGATLSPDGRYLTRPGVGCQLYDLRTGRGIDTDRHLIVAVCPDGKSVLTLPGIRGAERVSLEPLAWKVAPPPKPTETRLRELWKRLGEPAAMEAVFELARHSTEAVPFLKAKLLTDPPDAKAVAGHITKLGSKLFAERDAATKALRDIGPEVLPALRAALKADPSPEARSRIEKLLPVLADTAAPFTLVRLRAVEALERCGTPDARAVLEEVAMRPGTPWADDASRSLARLTK